MGRDMNFYPIPLIEISGMAATVAAMEAQGRSVKRLPQSGRTHTAKPSASGHRCHQAAIEFAIVVGPTDPDCCLAETRLVGLTPDRDANLS